MAAVKLPSLFVLPLPASTAGLSELPSTVLPRVCSEAACWHFSQGSFKITRWILMSFLLWKVKGWEAWPFSTENPTWNSFLYPGWLRQKQKFSCLSLESLWQGLSPFLPPAVWIELFRLHPSVRMWEVLGSMTASISGEEMVESESSCATDFQRFPCVSVGAGERLQTLDTFWCPA